MVVLAGSSSIANPFFEGPLAEVGALSASPAASPRIHPATRARVDSATSSCYMAFNEMALRPDDRLTRSEYQPKMKETPKFNYDMTFDLKVLQNALKSTSFLQDSGYRSQSESSQKPSMTASCHLYGTGWMMADDISDDESEDENWVKLAPNSAKINNVEMDSEICKMSTIELIDSIENKHSVTLPGIENDFEVIDCVEVEHEDQLDIPEGFVDVANQRIKVRDLSHILVSRFAFISGLRTSDGNPILTFPDSRSQLTFEEYQILLAYLFQVPPLDEDGAKKDKKGYVLIIDRRTDKWSAVRVLFSYLMNYFPEPVHLIFLLKPEGVLQRALEVGYRNFTENGQFNVVPCQSTSELRDYLAPDCLTMDVGGVLKYNHLEWVQHRMDIERMKSSAAVIAESLSEFGRCLRETELPNDVESTQRILEAQTSERDAIKEDFRISIRKGLQLLRQVRQLEQKPEAEQLSPTRLHNVTAIERMLIQLEDTEKSFDAFWSKHQQKLENCLKLRRFEEGFRKLQSSFAKHMIYLEEHRDVGDGVVRAKQLADEHDEYAENAMSDVQAARNLHQHGEALMSVGTDGQLSDSLAPKCDELSRMADALTSALDRRAQVLRLSVNMHRQISEATSWCRKGVDILSNIPLELNNTAALQSVKGLDEFLAEGATLQLDAFNQMPPNMTNLILLTTTETSSLLAHVSERIEDIKKLGFSRRDALQKIAERESNKKPIQVVSPEKTNKVRHPQQPNSNKRQIEVLHEFSDFAPSTSSEVSTPVASNSPTRGMAAMELASSQQYHSHCGLPSTSKAAYVLDELLTTEKTYVRELESIVEYYVNPFENPENEKHIPEGLRGQSSVIFGNFRDLYEFHNRHVLPDFQKAQYSPVLLCHIMINFRNHFLKLYRPYCQNKPQSESVRRDQQADGCRFFAECQKKAGHQLPLSAYLLKPIQRITKYQLLLKELLRHCQDEGNEEIKHDVQAALASMLDLLAQINADMQQLHILGYAGDLRLLGPLRLQTECEVYTFKRKTRRLSNKCQKRHLFLFDGGILFCKKRTQPVPYSPEFYEHKLCIYAQNLGFAECSKQSADRFEIWDEQKSDGFAIFATDEVVRAKWIQRLAKMTVLHAQQQKEGLQQNSNSRPHSWTSESTVSSRSSNFDENQTDSLNDNNGNPSSPSSDHHSATSGSVSSRRSSSHTASLGSDAENNTPLPVSKSLQNTALLGHAVSEV